MGILMFERVRNIPSDPGAPEYSTRGVRTFPSEPILPMR